MNPYPLLPLLTEKLHTVNDRIVQAEPKSKTTIHIALPISGAAVGMDFSATLITELHRLQPRMLFHIVAKTAPHTQKFREDMAQHLYNRIYTAYHDREVVDLYKKLYKQKVIAYEITKPSEHAFKCIADPSLRGGVIMLFTESVGLQERDNLDFLRRHELLPSYKTQKYLFHLASFQTPLQKNDELFQQANSWRGLSLPSNPVETAQFISWCQNNWLFRAMFNFKPPHFPVGDPRQEELRTDGVKLFWEKAASLLG